MAVSLTSPSTIWRGLTQWWMGVRPRPDLPPSDVISVQDWRWVGALLDGLKGMGLVWLLPPLGVEGQAFALAVAVIMGGWVGRLSILGTARVMMGVLVIHQPWALLIVGLAYPVMSTLLNRFTWGWVATWVLVWLITQDMVIGMLLVGGVLASWGRMMETLGMEGRWWWQFERRV